MNKSFWQTLQRHSIAVGFFLIVSCIYCAPSFKGMVVMQHDAVGWKGMAQQSITFKEKYGRYPLWTNAIFCGMPATQIALDSRWNITIGWLHYIFTMFLPQPAGLFFLACIGFYILSISLNVKIRIAVLGSIAYAFASYNAVLVAVGHTTKFSSMGYAPALIAGLILLSQRKYILGFIATLTFTTLLFYQNHLQIVFYTFIVIICFAIALLIKAIRTRKPFYFVKVIGLATLAGVIGVLSYSVILLPTYFYANETIRGGRSELTSPGNENNKSIRGLNKDYAFSYSYGITEILTIAVPRMYGGSFNEMPSSSETEETFLKNVNISEEQAQKFTKSISAYWGPQEGTSGAVYFGASVCVLFIFACAFYNKWHRSWIIAATILGIALAWGKHFSAFNYFLFDFFPFYNKFRAPSMAMVIPQLTIPLMAVLGLNEMMEMKLAPKLFWKKFRYASIITGIFVSTLLALYFMFDYRSSSDDFVRADLRSMFMQQRLGLPSSELQNRAAEFSKSVVEAARKDRKSLFRDDLVRSIIFLGFTWSLLYFFGKSKVNEVALATLLIFLVFVDLIGVDLRYLNNEDYVDKDEFNQYFLPTPADQQISKDTTYYRVFNYSDGDPFTLSGATSRTSFWHNSVGGYHPAKLALYNDLIIHQLSKGNMQVYNMLNTKYFVVNDPVSREPVVSQNPDALGSAWFVKAIKYVDNADEEMQALSHFHPRDTAIADKREHSKFNYTNNYDSTSKITLIENRNDYIAYSSFSKTNGIAVFSEIFYPHGWKAKIDGKKTPIARVNYVLRALSVPAGEHKIEFRFEPYSYFLGDRVSLIIGILSILIILVGVYVLWMKNREES